MTDIITYAPSLIAGVLILAAAFVFIGCQIWLTHKREVYLSTRVPVLDDIDKQIEAKKIEQEQLNKKIEELDQILADKEELSKTVAELKARINSLESQYIVDKELLEKYNNAKRELAGLNDEVTKKRAELQQIDVDIKKTNDELSVLKDQNTKQKAENTELETKLNELKDKFNENWQTLDGLLREKVSLDMAIQVLTTNKTQLEQKIEELQPESDKLKKELSDLRDDHKELTENVSKLAKDKEDKTRELNDLEALIATEQEENKNLDSQIATKQSSLESVEQQIASKKTLVDKVNKLKIESATLDKQLNDKRNELANAEIKLNAVNLEIIKKKGDLRDDEADPLESLKQEPACVREFNNIPHSASTDNNQEIEQLSSFSNSLREAGILFNDRTIKSFHTALKCQNINPLTVLAGVSGTGKTLLPIKYAEFMGMMHLTVSVQPRWDSPQDLFGFYNYMERKYQSTELARLLYAYNHDAQLKNVMSIVLFDEMNLARTEYYFSDFLSKLELRRLSEKDSDAAININVPGRGNEALNVPGNMLMIGTMNEDESTQTLSDKVLDRANVLRFGKPAKLSQANSEKLAGIADARNFVTKATWSSWFKKGLENTGAAKEVNGWISKLNDALECIGRPFGYRVQQAISSYVANYPTYDRNSYKIAFADQIEQKILPKMRGIDSHSSEYDNCIQIIQEVVSQTGDSDLENALNKANKAADEEGLFVWTGVTRS